MPATLHSSEVHEPRPTAAAPRPGKTIYTCPMHPEVRQDRPCRRQRRGGPDHRLPMREAPISEAQKRLIESGVGVVLLVDKDEGGIIVGLLTLHDLLRAQDALAREADTA